jgi:hypothetical protein
MRCGLSWTGEKKGATGAEIADAVSRAQHMILRVGRGKCRGEMILELSGTHLWFIYLARGRIQLLKQ